MIALTVDERFHRLTTELHLKQVKIDLLTNELHSHHLFNEFSRLSVMIRQDPEAAREYLVEFADMLRISLKYADQQQVALTIQLDYLNAYLRQQQLVAKERFQVEWDIRGDLNTVTLPWHLLFPLVENAVKNATQLTRHQPDQQAILHLSLNCGPRELVFSISNPYHPSLKAPSSATGLKNLKNRLDWFYPRHTYQLAFDQTDHIWTARLSLPLEV